MDLRAPCIFYQFRPGFHLIYDILEYCMCEAVRFYADHDHRRIEKLYREFPQTL